MTITEAIRIMRRERLELLAMLREGRCSMDLIQCNRELAEALRLACAALKGIAK